MTAPSQYLRDLREQRESRRLGVAKALRDTPNATNIELAKVFRVTRDTIAQDRKAIVEEIRKQTTNETELLRADMVQRLEHLNNELELHRKSGKLPVSVIHEMMLVHRSIIELLGIRKPVTEHLEVKKTTLRFETTIAGIRQPDGGITQSEPKSFELVRNQLALGEGNE